MAGENWRFSNLWETPNTSKNDDIMQSSRNYLDIEDIFDLS